MSVADLDGRRVEQIYEGQPVQYVITLSQAEKASPPELKGFDDFDVAFVGRRSLGMGRIEINGRVVQDIHGGMQFIYRLTPRKTGLLRMPGPAVEVDGRVLKGPDKTLQVLPADQQDVAFLKIASDRPAVYPMQPFTITLTVQIKALPEPADDRSPVSVQPHDPPALNIPWVVDDNLPDGLEPSVDWQNWLAPMQTRGNQGFSINNLGRSSVFSLFDDGPMRFEPSVRKVTRRDARGKGATYWQYEFPRTFVAKKIGTFGFGPVSLKGTFGTRMEDSRTLFVRPIYAPAKRIEVTVKDVPTEGRPKTFTGAIGRFTLRGELTPKRAKVGDPMTLTLTLTGEGTLGSTLAPDLEQVPEIASRFKAYKATEETSGDSSRFTYTLRPLKEGTDKFPSVPLTYFDVESERFATLKTDPIPISVTRADQLSADQIVATPHGSAAHRGEVEAQRGGIFANITDVAAVRNEQIRPARWLAGLGGLVGLYLAVAVVTVRIQRLTRDKALVRRRGAASDARRRLSEARAALKAGQARQGTETMEAALVHLVADVADVPVAGLTPKDVCGHLRTLGVEEDTIRRAARFLDACDAGRYGALSHDGQQMIEEAEALLRETIRSLDAKRRFR